jgi:nitrous oxidase accessory protein
MSPGAAVLVVASLLLDGQAPGTGREIVVDQQGAVRTIGEALARARDGDRLTIRPGTYREPTLRVARSVHIEGEGGAILDGQGARSIMVIVADDVTVRGLTFRATGSSHVEDRAAVLVQDARRCRIEQNRLDDTFFGISLMRVEDCVVAGNTIHSSAGSAGPGGNAIHAWQSQGVRVERNMVSGHRDGIYFEFVRDGFVAGNTSQGNHRYGLHFMFSDDCRYEGNTFRENAAGIAVMYTRRVHMSGNRFEHNWGPAAYGLLLKDITDSEIRDNDFSSNTIGLYLEGANRIRVEGNRFRSNGWAMKVLANSQDNVITHNTFVGNTFDVGTNSRQNFSRFTENYWDRYRGYDLDRDGFGDVAFGPVRLFALVVEQTPAALILLRSAIVDLLDIAERVMPMLTPATLVDERPLMRPGPSAVGQGPPHAAHAVAIRNLVVR